MTDDLSDDEALAAEYVLGTLAYDERVAAEQRLTRDLQLAELIAQWELRLSPLTDTVPGLVPPPQLFGELLRRLPQDQPADLGGNILVMRRQIRVWRGAAAIASALAAVLALWIVAQGLFPPTIPNQTYVAVLQHGADQPSFVVSLDLTTRRMTVMPVAANAPAGKSYELWMIGDKATPRSMGVIDAQAAMHPRLPDVGQGVLSNATYAVTLEPSGGSPTGQPTSAPLFVGKLMSTAL